MESWFSVFKMKGTEEKSGSVFVYLCWKKCFCQHFLSEAGPWSLRWRLLLRPPQQVPEQPHGWPALPSWWATERRQRRRCCELHAIPERDDRLVEKKCSHPEHSQWYGFTQMFVTEQKTLQKCPFWIKLFLLFGTILNCTINSKTQLTQNRHEQNRFTSHPRIHIPDTNWCKSPPYCIPCFLTGIWPSQRLCSTPVWYPAVLTGLSLVELSLIHRKASFEFWLFILLFFFFTPLKNPLTWEHKTYLIWLGASLFS